MVIPRSINARYYVHDLGSALTQDRIYDPDYALAQDPEFYEKLRRYPVVDGAVNLRKLMDAGSDWYLEPASSAIGDRAAIPIFEALVKEIKDFSVARYNSAEALIKGASWAEIEGEWRVLEIPPLPPMRWWVITGLKDMDKRRFVLCRDKDLEPDERRWYVETAFPPYEARPIVREHYLRIAAGTDEASLGYGRGLVESILYPFWYATGLDEHSAQFGERWAQGFRVWKLGIPGAPLTTDKRQQYLNTVDLFVSRYAAVVDKDDTFELHDAPAEGFNYITERQKYYNSLIRVRILGSSLMTEPEVKGGSFALGDSQFENTTQLIVHHDRGILDSGFTADCMSLLWRANYQNFVSLGIRTTGPSRFHTRDIKQHDPAKRAPVLKTALEIGLKILEDEAYQQLELTPPTGDAPVLQQANLPAPAPGRPPGGPPDGPEVPSKQDERLGFEHGQPPPPPVTLHAHFEAPPPAPPPTIENHIHNYVTADPPDVCVNVEAPRAPDVRVEAPVIVPERETNVYVELPAGKKKLEINRDRDGRISGAEIKPKE